MKKTLFTFYTILFMYCHLNLEAQTVQMGIFNPTGNTLSIRVKPNSNINNELFSFIQFTIRWEGSYGVTLININSTFSISSQAGGSINIGGTDYNYIVFAGTPNVQITWTSGSETTLLTADVTQTGDGFGTFFVAGNGELTDFGIEIGGSNLANPTTPFYQQSIGSVPLPVELATFTASNNQNIINLKWQTKTEVDNYGFEIQRSAVDLKSSVGNPQFEKIGFVPGSGNSNSPKDYSFNDNNPSGGNSFIYRLKQMDTDGKYSFSNEIKVDFVPDKYQLFQNYPNPFNPSTTIKFAVPKSGNIALSVYNLLGEKIKDLYTGFKEPGIYNFTFDGKELGSGTYIYRLQADDFVQVRKMMLIK